VVILKINSDLENSLQTLRQNHRQLRRLKTDQKNSVLSQLAVRLEKDAEVILRANQLDLKNLPADASVAFRDRLTLNPDRIKNMAESLRQVAALPDPVGEVVEEKTLGNGLQLKKIRWPLGIIFMIFESRPNVILEAFSLAFKSGNAMILRGGSDSRSTSDAIYKIMSQVLTEAALPSPAFCGIQDYDRGLVEILLKRKDLIDVVVPRGGEKLIEFVQKNSLMPIIKNDRGLCHAYVDEDADLEMAIRIVQNAKTQRPGVCNALETVLVHKSRAREFIPRLYQATDAVHLAWRADPATCEILKGRPRVQPATATDWNTEYLDLILNCRVVESLDEAIDHIELHGSKHSETIITSSEKKARRFQEEIDAAAVYWNASTRFTDGFEFGLGGELGISTQKLHVRGPVGLRELTTPRWLITGTGQIR
jgi:glutamate-5-semialdehyde dehydrogenase